MDSWIDLGATELFCVLEAEALPSLVERLPFAPADEGGPSLRNSMRSLVPDFLGTVGSLAWNLVRAPTLFEPWLCCVAGRAVGIGCAGIFLMVLEVDFTVFTVAEVPGRDDKALGSCFSFSGPVDRA